MATKKRGYIDMVSGFLENGMLNYISCPNFQLATVMVNGITTMNTWKVDKYVQFQVIDDKINYIHLTILKKCALDLKS